MRFGTVTVLRLSACNLSLDHTYRLRLYLRQTSRMGSTAADPGGGGPGGPGPPPDPRFWGPKIEHFAALFNFSIIFFASLRSAYYFFNMLLFHSSNWKIFQPRFARHVISHLQVLVSHILGY